MSDPALEQGIETDETPAQVASEAKPDTVEGTVLADVIKRLAVRWPGEFGGFLTADGHLKLPHHPEYPR